LQVGIVLVLFTITWYLCASRTRQAFRGLGERIEAKGDSDRLLTWAAEVIAAQRQREQALPVKVATAVGLLASPLGQGPFLAIPTVVLVTMEERSYRLEREALPDWVIDLMGPFQGVQSAMVYLSPAGVVGEGDDPCVILYTGGSGYHFQIILRPSRVNRSPSPWWFGELDGLECRPGIYLSTEGK
jgi:hypothetical protein